MRLFNFLVWLTTGALIGWFAGRLVSAENLRIQKSEADSEDYE